MSCNGCAAKYSLFNKEHGCPQCGFSYCSKCLKYKATVPKLGNTEHLVCKSCQTALTNVLETRGTQREHPAASLQRLASLEGPPRPPITVYKHDQRIQELKAGLTQSTDKEIADRLEKLREDRKREPLPSEDEIAKRLALLKGENPMRIPPVESKPIVPRSEQQQADDLLAQLQEEQQIALSQTSPVDEITSRLAQLRGQGLPSQSGVEQGSAASVTVESMHLGDVDSLSTSELDAELKKTAEGCVKDARAMLKKSKLKEGSEAAMSATDLDNDDESEQELIKKILEEAALDEKSELSDDSREADVDMEELPWCVICDKNAQLKCIDCSGDLYCKACFKEGHTDFDMKDHKTVPFKPANTE